MRQQGCLKLLFPRAHDGPALQAVTVNSSGGVAAGDRLDAAYHCGPGASLLVTAQAAERCYRARDGEAPAHITARVLLDARADLEWLPQETILFDGASLRRRLEVDMEPTARLLCLESRVFGRALHGERMRTLDVSDRILVRRAGRPILVDGFELHGDAEAALARRAIGAGAVAAAGILLVAPDAPGLLEAVREVPAQAGCEFGASAWNGMLRIAMVSRDASSHRVLIAALLSVLRRGADLPAVWRC